MTRVVSNTFSLTVRDPSVFPSWRLGMVAWEWKELPNTSLSSLSVVDPTDGATMLTPAGRVDAYNGMAVNRTDGTIWLARAGGHNDWSGNEVYRIALNVDNPATVGWEILRQPTILPEPLSDSWAVSHYWDGRPSSTHLYYALHHCAARNRLFTYYSGGVYEQVTSGTGFPKVDAYRLSDDDWDAAGSYTDMPGSLTTDLNMCQDPSTEDVYTVGGGYYVRWRQTDAMWVNVAAIPSGRGSDLHGASPSAFDTSRGRVFFVQDAYRAAFYEGRLLDVSGGTSSAAVLTGTDRNTVFAALKDGLEYVPDEDAYLLKTRTGGNVYRIDASTFECTQVTVSGGTVPDSFNGVYNRFVYVPNLGGCVYLPRHSANCWFLATE